MLKINNFALLLLAAFTLNASAKVMSAPMPLCTSAGVWSLPYGWGWYAGQTPSGDCHSFKIDYSSFVITSIVNQYTNSYSNVLVFYRYTDHNNNLNTISYGSSNYAPWGINRYWQTNQNIAYCEKAPSSCPIVSIN